MGGMDSPVYLPRYMDRQGDDRSKLLVLALLARIKDEVQVFLITQCKEIDGGVMTRK